MNLSETIPNSLKCKECGGEACICQDDDLWAAHCMDCDNAVGVRGEYDPCCKSKIDAIQKWNELNKDQSK